MTVVLNAAFALAFLTAVAYHGIKMWRTARQYHDFEGQIRRFFDDLLRTIEGTASVDERWSLDEYLRHVIDDVNSVLARDEKDPVRVGFFQRYLQKREQRLTCLAFAKSDNISRRLIEVYPPLGILGTVCSLYVSTASGGDGTDAIIQNFMTAMWTTIAGIVLWITFTLIYARFEPEWERLPESERKARDLVWDIDRAYRGGAG